MRIAILASAIGLIAGCAQGGGNQQAGTGDGVADPGLPGGGGTSGPAAQNSGANIPAALRNIAADPSTAVSNCLSPEDQVRQINDFSPEERAEKLGCINAAMAEQINRQLPLKIDPLTSLTRIESAGPVLTYLYTVDVDGARVPPGAMDQVKAGARANACSKPQMRQRLSYGGVYAYRWSDKNGRVLGDLRIDAC